MDAANLSRKDSLEKEEDKCNSLGSPLYINENEYEEDELISNVAVVGTSSPFLASQSPLDEEQHAHIMNHDEMNSREDILEHEFIDDDDEDEDEDEVNADVANAVMHHSNVDDKNNIFEKIDGEKSDKELLSKSTSTNLTPLPPSLTPQTETEKVEHVVLNKTNLASFERSMQEGRVPLRADTVAGNYIDSSKGNINNAAKIVNVTSIHNSNTNTNDTPLITDINKEAAENTDKGKSNAKLNENSNQTSVSDSTRTNYPASATLRTGFDSSNSLVSSSIPPPPVAAAAVVPAVQHTSPPICPVLPAYNTCSNNNNNNNNNNNIDNNNIDKYKNSVDNSKGNVNTHKEAAELREEEYKQQKQQQQHSPKVNELHDKLRDQHSREYELAEHENKTESSLWLESVNTNNDSDQLHLHVSNEDSVRALAGDEEENAIGPSPNLYQYLHSARENDLRCVHVNDKAITHTMEARKSAVPVSSHISNSAAAKELQPVHGSAKAHYTTVHVDVSDRLRNQREGKQELETEWIHNASGRRKSNQEQHEQQVDVCANQQSNNSKNSSSAAVNAETNEPFVSSAVPLAASQKPLPSHSAATTSVTFVQSSQLHQSRQLQSSQEIHPATNHNYNLEHHHIGNHYQNNIRERGKLSELSSVMSPNSSIINDKLSMCSNESLPNHSSQLTLADPLNEENLKLHLMELNSGIPLPLRVENIVSNFECVKAKPLHSNAQETNDSNKDSCSHIPQPSETEPSITITRFLSTEKDDDEMNIGSVSTASPITYRARTDGDDDVRHHGFGSDNVNRNNNDGENGSLSNNNNNNNSNSNNINNNRSSLYDLIEDAWSTTSTGEAELNFLSTCSNLSEQNIQSLSKESLQQFRRQLESGTTPLRPEILAGLSGFVRSIAQSRAHSEVSSMLVEVPRDEERQLNDKSITSTDSPLIRRHTRSKERKTTKNKEMPPPSKVSKTLALTNHSTSSQSKHDSNNHTESAKRVQISDVNKIPTNVVEATTSPNTYFQEKCKENTSNEVTPVKRTSDKIASRQEHQGQHKCYNPSQADKQDSKIFREKKEKKSLKTAEQHIKRSPKRNSEKANIAAASASPPSSFSSSPQAPHFTPKQSLPEVLYDDVNEEITGEDDLHEQCFSTEVHGRHDDDDEDEINDDDDDDDEIDDQDDMLSLELEEEELLEEEEENEEGTIPHDKDQVSLEDGEEIMKHKDKMLKEGESEETSRIMPSKPILRCEVDPHDTTYDPNTNHHNQHQHQHHHRSNHVDSKHRVAHDNFVTKTHKRHKSHKMHDLANVSENDEIAGVSFNSTAVEAPETEVNDEYSQHEHQHSHLHDGTATNNSSIHDDTNESVDNKKNSTPCSRGVHFDHMDEYEMHEVIKLKEQMREVNTAVMHLQTDFSLLRTSLDTKLEAVFCTLDGQLKNAAKLTADIQFMHQTLVNRLAETNTNSIVAHTNTENVEQVATTTAAIHSTLPTDNIANLTTLTSADQLNTSINNNNKDSNTNTVVVKIPLVMRVEIADNDNNNSVYFNGQDFIVPCSVEATIGECKQEFLRRLHTLECKSNDCDNNSMQLDASNTILSVDNRVLFDQDKLCHSLGITNYTNAAKEKLAKNVLILQSISKAKNASN